MYVVGENPLLSEPDLHHATKAIAQLDCLVVQDLFMHETAELAHVFLPAAGFAEKDGTFTNSERRVQRVRTALDAARRGAARLVDHRPSSPGAWPGASASTSSTPVRSIGAPRRSSTRWRGSSRSSAASPTSGSIARAACSGPVRRRPPRHAVPLRRVLSRAATAQLHPRAADRRGRRAARPGLPVRPQHGPAALSLARRHHDPPRRGAARARAAPRGRPPSGGRAPARRRDRRRDPRDRRGAASSRASRASPRRCARAPSSSRS